MARVAAGTLVTVRVGGPALTTATALIWWCGRVFDSRSGGLGLVADGANMTRRGHETLSGAAAGVDRSAGAGSRGSSHVTRLRCPVNTLRDRTPAPERDGGRRFTRVVGRSRTPVQRVFSILINGRLLRSEGRGRPARSRSPGDRRATQPTGRLERVEGSVDGTPKRRRSTGPARLPPAWSCPSA